MDTAISRLPGRIREALAPELDDCEPEVIETPVSWVLLSQRFAYKVKKPVRHDIYDFSDAAVRRNACYDELRLNRRFSVRTYINVLPVSRGPDGRFRVGNSDRPVEWIIKMRRLPQDSMLSFRLSLGDLSERDVRLLRELIRQLLSSVSPIFITPAEYARQIEEQIADNHRRLSQLLSARRQSGSDRLHQALLSFSRENRELWQQRVCDGRIVEGHGDLRPNHIYLRNPPTLIDGVETRFDLRCLDTCDELALLMMECERQGHPRLAQRMVGWYHEFSEDEPPGKLWDFFKCFRALVRARMSRLDRPAVPHVKSDPTTTYLRLAESYLGGKGRYGVNRKRIRPNTGTRTSGRRSVSR